MAKVAWPQRGTSTSGVNHWSFRIPACSGSGGPTKAVSERFISAAIFCISFGSRASDRRQTAAGLPWNGAAAKASTLKRGMEGALGTRESLWDVGRGDGSIWAECGEFFSRRFDASSPSGSPS